PVGGSRAQRERGAGGDGALGVLLEVARDRLGIDDRIAPFVQRDTLGKELGAQAVRFAFDRIDTKRLAHLPPRPEGADADLPSSSTTSTRTSELSLREMSGR